MTNVDKKYLDLVRDILENGTRKQTRAGEVLSVFDRTLRFPLREGLPLLTTKKVFTKGCITELLWFLSGDTNIRYLIENGVNIWTDDAYRYYTELCSRHNACEDIYEDTYTIRPEDKVPVTKEEFTERVKNGHVEHFCITAPNNWEDQGIDYCYGDLGDVYGKQWRSYGISGFDQIGSIVRTLRENPDDRRMLCVAFNPDSLRSLEGVALPPCHVMFQFWTRLLTEDERMKISSQTGSGDVPERELSMMFVQRSCDVMCGEPFNILSYSILLEMMCRVVNMVPGEMVQHAVDCHIYANHIEGAKEQISRTGSDVAPRLKFREGKEYRDLSDFEYGDFIIEDYYPDAPIKFQLNVG